MLFEKLNSDGAILTPYLAQLIALASVMGVLLACVVAVTAWYSNSRKVRKRRSGFTTVYFCITFLLGFAVYCVGLMPYSEGNVLQQFIALLGVAPMALVDTVGMFLLQTQWGDANDACRSSWLYVTIFSILHATAAFISTTVIIHHFGFSLVAKIRFSITSHVGKKTEDLFIFWGMNESSYLLAKDILAHETKRYRMIFVYDGTQEEDEEHSAEESHLLSFLKMPRVDLQRFKELKCLICQPSRRLSDLRLEARGREAEIITKELHMNGLARIIRKANGTVHHFFLGDNEARNLRAVTLLRHDHLLLERVHEGKIVKFYARAETTGVSQAINDLNREPAMEIQIIDASEHSIQFLKSHPEYHPIHYVDIDAEKNYGTVKTPFHCMLVGFGWTGQEALRFLYEYGAFVDSRSTMAEDFCGVTADGEKAHVFRSPFTCDIVDPEVGKQADMFFGLYPAMRQTEGAVHLNLLEECCESEAVFNLIDEGAKTLNYIVIATGNDDMNLEIAINLFNRIRRVRRDMQKLNLFVQCTSAERALHFRAVLQHYNQEGEVLVLFGTNEMIYTYNHIVHNEYEMRGRLYNESYCRVNQSKDNYWKVRHEKLVKRGTLDALASLHRKEWQDFQNAYHAPTKAYLYEQACPKVRPVEELIRIICGNGNECNFRRFVPYPISDTVNAPEVDKPVCAMTHDTQKATKALTEGEELFLRNQARLEHLRWNASHEAMGYISLNAYIAKNGDDFSLEPYETKHTCSEVRRCHNCLIGWEDLDQESLNTWNEIVEHDGYRWNPDYKLADFGVVANALYHSYTQEQH